VDISKTAKIPERIFFLVTAVCAAAVIASTIQAFHWISDPSLTGGNGILSREESEALKNGIIMVYLVRIVPFTGFAVNTALAYYRTGITNVFLVIWSMVLLGMMVLHLLSFNYRSIVWYILAAGYLFLISSLFIMKSQLTERDQRGT